jgi:hypothetical protein
VADAGLDAGDDACLGWPQGGVTGWVTREVTRDIECQAGDSRQLGQQLMLEAGCVVVQLELIRAALQLCCTLF